MAGFGISSSAFPAGDELPARYTCDGEDNSPPRAIAGVPDGARSLALVVDDPDAPRGTWDHWILYGISPGTSMIPEATVPPGALEGKNGWGGTGWRGPCPPEGRHRYFFRLYALDAELDLPAGASRQRLEAAMGSHVMAVAELMATYARRGRGDG
jgi:Raf kinase inhibitor-like YbhB/YbcL family protein